MDANTVSSLISNLGFPIACCAALFWYMIKQDERHKAETDKLSEAIQNNTLIMTKLLDRMEGDTSVQGRRLPQEN